MVSKVNNGLSDNTSSKGFDLFNGLVGSSQDVDDLSALRHSRNTK